jgi:hypothetical protein
MREATEALERLLLFVNQQTEEYQDDKLTQALHSYQRKLNRRRMEIRSNMMQGRLEDFWGPHLEHLPVKEQIALADAAYRQTLDSGSEVFHDSDFERMGVDHPGRRSPLATSDILVCAAQTPRHSF